MSYAHPGEYPKNVEALSNAEIINNLIDPGTFDDQVDYSEKEWQDFENYKNAAYSALNNRNIAPAERLWLAIAAPKPDYAADWFIKGVNFDDYSAHDRKRIADFVANISPEIDRCFVERNSNLNDSVYFLKISKFPWRQKDKTKETIELFINKHRSNLTGDVLTKIIKHSPCAGHTIIRSGLLNKEHIESITDTIIKNAVWHKNPDWQIDNSYLLADIISLDLLETEQVINVCLAIHNFVYPKKFVPAIGEFFGRHDCGADRLIELANKVNQEDFILALVKSKKITPQQSIDLIEKCKAFDEETLLDLLRTKTFNFEQRYLIMEKARSRHFIKTFLSEGFGLRDN